MDLTERKRKEEHLCFHASLLEQVPNPSSPLTCNENLPIGTGAFATARLIKQDLLLDLKLPKVDGIEVLRAVKSQPQTRMIPVVMLTSSKEERDMVESYSLDVNSYIQKSLDFNQFRQAIKAVSFYWLVVNQPAAEKALAMIEPHQKHENCSVPPNVPPDDGAVVTLPGTVEAVIPPIDPWEPKREIGVEVADPLYREIRVEDVLKAADGQKVKLKPGVQVPVTIEADAAATEPATAAHPLHPESYGITPPLSELTALGSAAP